MYVLFDPKDSIVMDKGKYRYIQNEASLKDAVNEDVGDVA